MPDNYDDEETIVIGRDALTREEMDTVLGVAEPYQGNPLHRLEYPAVGDDTLLGVAYSELVEECAEEQDRHARPYEDAHGRAVQALAMTQERLASLRKQRAEINEEIKTLVDDEVLLTRMSRVRPGQRAT